MSIDYPLSLPSSKFQRMAIKASSAAVPSRSPFTYATQVQRWDGQIWFMDVALRLFEPAEARIWIAFLQSLKGSYGTFLAGDPNMATSAGIGTGTPLVKGASQTGEQIITDGWTVSQTGIMKAGDYLSIDNHLYMVLQDADSDSSGNATFEIFPRIRGTIADNTTIVTSSPMGLWRLTDSLVEWETNEERLYSINFSAMEAL